MVMRSQARSFKIAAPFVFTNCTESLPVDEDHI